KRSAPHPTGVVLLPLDRLSAEPANSIGFGKVQVCYHSSLVHWRVNGKESGRESPDASPRRTNPGGLRWAKALVRQIAHVCHRSPPFLWLGALLRAAHSVSAGITSTHVIGLLDTLLPVVHTAWQFHWTVRCGRGEARRWASDGALNDKR